MDAANGKAKYGTYELYWRKFPPDPSKSRIKFEDVKN
jgi:hypothetical protein